MTDYAWPAHLIPNASEWWLAANTAAFSSPLTGSTRTLGRGGDRWGCTLTVVNLKGEDRALLASWLARLRGQAHRVILPDHAFARRGSFPTGELLSNTRFTDTTGWDVSDAAELAIKVDTAALRSTRVAVGTSRLVRHVPAITTVTNARYLLRATAIDGRAAPRWTLRAGSTVGGNEYLDGTLNTAGGVAHVMNIVTGTTVYASIQDNIGGSRIAGDYQLFAQPSFARCFYVAGASQSGSGLNAGGLPVSTDGVLLAGDFVGVYTAAGWELKMLTSNLNADSGGLGHFAFTPPLRASPADLAPVAVHKPFARFLLSNNQAGWSNRPGGISSFSVDVIEDIAP